MRNVHRAVCRALALAVASAGLSLTAATPATAAPEPASPPSGRPMSLPRAALVDAPRDAAVTGLVYDRAGDLVDNVMVEALLATDRESEPVAFDLTYEEGDVASHGAYRLELPAGEYLIRYSSLDDEDGFETHYYGGRSGTPVTAGAGATVELDDVTLTRETGAPVSGTVLDESGSPTRGAEVELHRVTAGGSYDVDWDVTDAAGRYTFERVNTARSHTIVVGGVSDRTGDWIDYPDVYLGQAPTAGSARTFTLPSGSTGTTLEPIRLHPGVALSGSVVDAEGAAIDYPAIDVLHVDGADRRRTGAVIGHDHDRSGHFTARVLPGHTYTVGAADDDSGWEEWRYLGDTLTLSEARTVAVAQAPVQLGQIRIVPDPEARTVTGAVRLLAGQIPQGVSLSLLAGPAELEEGELPDDWWGHVRSARLDAQGRFSLVVPREAVEESTRFTIRVSGDDVPDTYLGGSTTLADAETFIAPEPGVTRDLGTLSVDDLAQAVTGLVRGDGAPAAGAEVVLHGEHPDWGWDSLRTTETGDDGRYRLRVPAWVHEDGYERFTIEVDGGTAYHATYLGGATDIDAAVTFPAPAAGESLTLDPIDQVARDGVLSGRVLLPAGAAWPRDTEVGVELYRWSESDDGPGWWEWLRTSWSGSGSYGFADLEPGVYTVQARPYSWTDAPTPYLPTWGGGDVAAPSGPGARGTVEVTEDAVRTAGPEVRLVRGVPVTGTVRGTSGAPVTNASVGLYGWAADGSLGRDFQTHVTSDDEGRYTAYVVAGADLWLTVNRRGYQGYRLGGEDPPNEQSPANTLTVGADGARHDLALTPAWGAVGRVAGEQREYCLAHTRGDVEFDGRDLEVDRGAILPADRVHDAHPPLHPQDRDPVLAPLWSEDRWSSDHTWGVSPSGDTLCVQFQGTEEESTPTVQVLISSKAEGRGYRVTYNYDAVPGSATGDVAGYGDGEGTHGATVRFAGGDVDNGYADANEQSGLVHGSLGAGDEAGRYVFDFAGFDDRGDAPENVEAPTLTADPAFKPGATLTADPGTWTLDGVAAESLEHTYEWRWANGRVRQTGPSPTYTTTAADTGRRVRVRVRTWAPWRERAEAQTRAVLIGEPSATNLTPPSITPASGRAGQLFTADPGEWSPAESVGDGALSYAYAWYAGTSKVGSGATYRADSQDVGQPLTVRVTATAAGHSGVVAASAPVVVAQPTPLTWSTEPSLTGTTQVGHALTLDPGVLAETEDAARTVRWSVGGLARNPDPGSDGLAFTPRAKDVGRLVSARVTYSAPGHGSRTWSTTVGPVAGAASATAALVVTVRSGSGPVTGAWVTVCDETNQTCLGGAVDADGVHRTTGTAGETYRVSVLSRTEGLQDAASVVTMPGDGTDRSLEVRLTAPPTAPTNVSVGGNVGSTDQPTIVPGRDQTFTVTGCATTATPRYSLEVDGRQVLSGPMTKGAVSGDLATFTAVIPARSVPTTGFRFVTTVPADCRPDTAPTEVFVYIDPSGYVTDQFGRPLPGATVTLLRADDLGGPFAVVPDGSPIMSPENRSNPSLTDADGFFRWDVTEGWYKVTARATGCQEATTDAMQVLPARVDLLVKLTCEDPAPDATVPVTGDPVVGSTLSTSTDIWDSRYETTVQWLRGGTPIPGATSATYALSADDLGARISVEHTVRRPDYRQEEGRGATVSFTGFTRASAVRTVRAGAAPRGSVSIAGTAALGKTLTAVRGAWPADVVLAHTWRVGGTAVGTGTTYRVRAADVGKVVTLHVVATRRGYADGSAVSRGVTVAKVRPTVRLSASTKRVKGKKVLLAKVTVTAPGLARPSGKVVIYSGKRKVATVSLAAAKKGTVSVRLTKLKKGKHRLRATYAGSATLTAAESTILTTRLK